MQVNQISNSLTGKLILKNTVINFIGQVLPILAAIIGVPVLIKFLGVERFGILSLLWMVMWYSTMLDLGLGRATTKFVSEEIAKSNFEKIPKIFWTSALVQFGIGVLIGMVFFALTPIVVEKFLKISPSILEETKLAFYLISFSAPIILVSTSFQGVLEAYQRFDLVNAVIVPVKIGVLILSIVGALLNLKLYGIIFLLILMRVFMILVLFFLDVKINPEIRKVFNFDFNLLPSLFSFGGWVTVVNIVNPVLIYSDRFLIGAILSTSVLAYYTAPFEVVQRLWVIPASFTMTLFPAFSLLSGGNQDERISNLFSRAVKLTFIALFPIVFVISFFSSEILNLWLGHEFALKSSNIFKILAYGILLNSIAGFPMILFQGIGKPDVIAKVYIAELVLYIPLLSLFIYKFGIVGAGLGWIIRQVIDIVILFGLIFGKKTIRMKEFINAEMLELGLFFLLSILIVMYADSLSLIFKFISAVSLLCVFMYVVWFRVLNGEERNAVKVFVKIKKF